MSTQRELKFRAFKDGVMSQPFRLGDATYTNSDNGIHWVRDEVVSWDIEESHILMQYTGMKDGAGKEIYEGDIVATDLSYVPRGQVMYHDERGVWILHDPGHYDETLYMVSPVEIIGNIHEHPELLKP